MTPGTGSKAAKGAKVTFDYVIVNGRTGAELETSYGTGPVSLVLDKSQAQPVIVDGLVGTTVGSRVADRDRAEGGIREERAVRRGEEERHAAVRGRPRRRAGAARARRGRRGRRRSTGCRRWTLGKNGKPTVTVPKGDAPTGLVVQPLIKGTGPVVAGRAVDHRALHRRDLGQRQGVRLVVEARCAHGDFAIGTGGVIAGWDEGLVGQTVGSQVLLVIPPDKGYGSQGASDAGIKGTDTLVFVVDILDAT